MILNATPHHLTDIESPTGKTMYRPEVIPSFRTGDKHALRFITGRNGNYITEYSGSTIAPYVILKELSTELDDDLKVISTELNDDLEVTTTELDIDLTVLTTELVADLKVSSNELACMPHCKYMRSHDTHNDSFIVQ